jgi:hypothetical protein
MTTKTFEEFMSEINSTNIAEALKNAEKCLEAFEARDIIKQQQETIDRQLEEINRLLLRIDILAGEKSLCEIKARHCIAQYKAEAVKEFAEKLRVTADEEWYTLDDDDEYHMEKIVRMHFIDEIEKEMVGAEK